MKFGRWKYNKRTKELTLMNGIERFYIVNMKEMNTSAECLDWIFQVLGKSFIEPQDMYYLLEAIDVIINPQANLCSGGIEKNGRQI